MRVPKRFGEVSGNASFRSAAIRFCSCSITAPGFRKKVSMSAQIVLSRKDPLTSLEGQRWPISPHRPASAALPAPGLNLRGGVLFPGENGRSRREGALYKNNLGPRFGFAWQPLPKTVVRGGYGLFFSSILGNTASLGKGTGSVSRPS